MFLQILKAFLLHVFLTYGYLLPYTLHSNLYIYFKNLKDFWDSAVVAVRLRNYRPFAEPLKMTFIPADLCPLKRISI